MRQPGPEASVLTIVLNYPPPLQSIPNRNLGANGVMDKALTCWVSGHGLISMVGNSDLGAAMIR